MNIFNVSEEERNKSIDELLNTFTEEELLDELVECGLVLEKVEILKDEDMECLKIEYKTSNFYQTNERKSFFDYIKKRTSSFEFLINKNEKREMVA